MDENEKQSEKKIVIHTYEDDLALAMNTTDVGVVQEMLQNARDKESAQAHAQTVLKQRKWWTTGAWILLILGIASLGYGIYFYRNLTVGVEQVPSVGVFTNTNPIYISEEDVISAIPKLIESSNLAVNKPVLVPLISDPQSLTELNVEQTFKYLNIDATEPFLLPISLGRLGLMDNGKRANTFLIFSVSDTEQATKEFLIAEPNFLKMFSSILNIDTSDPALEIDNKFSSSFIYNLPVRTLKSTNLDTKEETILLYYAYVTNNTLLIATDPNILKSVYDTIIKQH